MGRNEGSNFKKAVFFSFGQISSQTAYQSFILLIFTFYYAVVGINIWLVTLGYVIWAIWNAFNDPMIGYLSDRTHTRWGRRVPYIMFSFIPLAISCALLYFPPLPIGETNQVGNFLYFLIIIVIFELFYTAFDLPQTAMFPEVFMTQKERTQCNNIREIFIVIALILAFILPGLIISSYTKASSLGEYRLFGIIVGIIVIAGTLVFLFFAPREKKEFSEDYKKAFGFFKTIKYCLKSKSFRFYVISELCNWFVYGMLPTIVPLYAEFVLHIEDPLMISLLLGFVFISAMVFMTVLWKPLVRKLGNRKTWMISMSVWICTLVPLMFIDNLISGMIVFFLIGIGLSGSLFIIDLVVSDIVDEDEIVTGIRREAGYYGVNALIMRVSNVLVILAIGSVLSTVGWTTFAPESATSEVLFGLRVLMFIFPAIALVIAVLAIYKYPLHGERLLQVKENQKKVHEEKKGKMEIDFS
ncbi:MAG: MFS transporter [Candidatus Hermodarchaeota archaeon]